MGQPITIELFTLILYALGFAGGIFMFLFSLANRLTRVETHVLHIAHALGVATRKGDLDAD